MKIRVFWDAIFRMYTLGSLFLSMMVIGSLSCAKPCNLRPSAAPELRGFKIGMSLAEIRQKYPTLPPITANEYGQTKIYFDRMPKVNQSGLGTHFVTADFYAEFKGTRRVYLELVDERIATLKVIYTNDIPWKSDEEFVKQTAESLSIPGSWSGKDGYHSVQCEEGLFFRAGIGRDLSHIPSATDEKFPYFEMFDVRAQMQIVGREADKQREANKQKEVQKNTFRP